MARIARPPMLYMRKGWRYLLLTWCVGSIFTFQHAHLLLQQEVKECVSDKSKLLYQYYQVAFSALENLKQQMRLNMDRVQQGVLQPLWPKDLHQSSRYPVYRLSDSYQQKFTTPVASLSGAGNIADLTPALLAEMQAVLSLNLKGPLAIPNHPFVWSYYTSKNQFIYLAPVVPLADFYFTSDVYEKPFWSIVIPENNPKRHTLSSKPYIDGAGQGQMVSMSAPFYYHDQFIGVFSLDVLTAQIEKILASHKYILGMTLSLYSSQGEVIAASPAQATHADYNQLFSNTPTERLINGRVYFIHPIVNRSALVASLPLGHFILAIVKFMLPVMLVFTGVLLLFRLFYSFRKVRDLAYQDGLTGLFNRHSLDWLGRQILSIGYRQQQPTALLMLDVDFFKKINDTYGHSEGDKALVLLAKLLNKSFRKSDVIGRYGGEEFVIIMPNTTLEKAVILAEILRERIERETAVSSDRLAFTVSIGCTQHALENEEVLDTLITRADKALYQAKNNGRNRVEIIETAIGAVR